MTAHKDRKFSDELVQQMRWVARTKGYGAAAIAREFDIPVGTARNIVTYLNYQNVPDKDFTDDELAQS